MASITATATSTPPISPPRNEIDREIQLIIKENNGKRPDQEQLDDLLFDAAEDQKLLRLKALLAMGANPNIQDDEGGTPLLDAAHEGYEGVVEVLLNDPRTNPNIPDDEGGTPLHHAVGKNHPRVIQMLLEDKHIDPTVKTKYGYTVLHSAVHTDSAKMMHILVQDGRIDPNDGPIGYRNPEKLFKTTPLILAAREKHAEAAQALLVDPRTDPNLGDFFTPLQQATWAGHTATVRVLLADPRTNPNLDPGCHLPFFNLEDIGIFELFLQNGRTDLTREGDDFGNTALHKYASKGKVEFVRALLARGADPMIRNKSGDTCFDLVRKVYHSVLNAEKPDCKKCFDLIECFDAMRPSLLGRLVFFSSWEQKRTMNEKASAATTTGPLEPLKINLGDLPLDRVLSILDQLPRPERIPPIEIPPKQAATWRPVTDRAQDEQC